MSSWNDDDLRAIAKSHDLYISPFREDGITYGTPTLVWPLVVDGEVYVRAANGQQSSWYMAAMNQRADGSTSVAKTMRSRSSPVATRSPPPSTLRTRESTRTAQPCRSCMETGRPRQP
jgi:hypothetical protein